MNNHTTRHRLFTAGVVLLVLLCVGVIGAIARINDSTLREELLRHATLVAAILDPSEMESLSFSLRDRENPLFLAIKERLRTFGQTLAKQWTLGKRYIGIYTMRRLPDGSIIFGPENIPPDDPRASSPGTCYKQPPAAVFQAFEEGLDITEGPYTDEYGTYVSAFIPLTLNGKVVTVVGMDIETEDWYIEVARRTTFPALLVILLLALSVSWHLRATSVRQLREREEEYRLLTENAVSGIAVHEMLFDAAGKPIDYVFLHANPAFEKHTGLTVSRILGKRVTEVLPGIEQTPFIERYG